MDAVAAVVQGTPQATRTAMTVLLAGEINRASPPQTRSALLEGMEERRVSVDGETHALPAPFMVVATANPATAGELRAVEPEELAEPLEAGYVEAEEVPATATQLAELLATEAGATTDYDTALAYQEYFRSEFAYSLTATTPAGEDPLDSFLAERVGYCEQFAATFALMVLSQGYPARVAIGFTSGETEGEDRVVTTDNAHAWPEVWFGPEHGWVRFEPTPAAAANGVSTPAWTIEDEETEAAEEETSEVTTEEETPSAEEESTTTSSPTGTEDEVVGSASTSGARRGILLAGLTVLLVAAVAALGVFRSRAREAARLARWDALEAEPADGAREPTSAATERRRRAAGELAWEDLDGALRRRSRAKTWLGWTGRWGRPPLDLHRDPALPPREALDALLDQAATGRTEVTAEHRAAAVRLACAVADARYAAPPDGGDSATGAPDGTFAGLRADSETLRRLVLTAR